MIFHRLIKFSYEKRVGYFGFLFDDVEDIKITVLFGNCKALLMHAAHQLLQLDILLSNVYGDELGTFVTKLCNFWNEKKKLMEVHTRKSRRSFMKL